MPDLLIELFSEEIPASMQNKACDNLKDLMVKGLTAAGLKYGKASSFSTPRRLTLVIDGLPSKTPVLHEERRGPRSNAPVAAVEGFLKTVGLKENELELKKEKKGEFYYAKFNRPGRPTSDVVSHLLKELVTNFPWQKSMRWGNGNLRWIRPLRSVLCLLYDEVENFVVPFEFEGIRSCDTTFGNRLMAPNKIRVTSFCHYRKKLKQAFVILDSKERADIINKEATNQAAALGLEVVEDAQLLSEVAGLLEWPVVLMGEIKKDYLELPEEVIRTSMKEHQKFFSVRNPTSGQIERFITVANRETIDGGRSILAGNQKVLAARLDDAKFFWENDLRTVRENGLDYWNNKLAKVTFHNKLGSEAERINRLIKLSRIIAPLVNAEPFEAERAAKYVKSDLASEMVCEFPELQGIMGKYYCSEAGLPVEFALACEKHYAPVGPTDLVPDQPISITIALADKLDKLASFWMIEEKPTGSKDPFALRRAALGVIRILLENQLRVKLLNVIGKRYNNLNSRSLLGFFHERLKVLLRAQNIRHDIIDAAIAMGNSDDVYLVVVRARALSNFLESEDGENLFQSFKRANNILSQAEEKYDKKFSRAANLDYADGEEERELFKALAKITPSISKAIEMENFGKAMKELASLRKKVDTFFEAVQINTDNQIVRENRLNLLSQIRTICLSIADFNKLDS